jgi:hypothetical protein
MSLRKILAAEVDLAEKSNNNTINNKNNKFPLNKSRRINT